MRTLVTLATTAMIVAWCISKVGISAAVAAPAHIHGVGILNVALEADKLIIELEAPGSDIVGFEHAPTEERDKQTVRNAVRTLKNGLALFQPTADAACRQEDVELHSELLVRGGEHSNDRTHKEHAHKDHEEKEHGHRSAGNESVQEAHAEFHVLYRFVCSSPDKLTHLDLGYFKIFPRARELEARIITKDGQSAKELTPAFPQLRF